MTLKKVVTTIDSLLELTKDYTGGQIPEGAKAIKLMIHPQMRKVAIVAESSEWSHGMDPIGVKFHLQRVYGVGG